MAEGILGAARITHLAVRDVFDLIPQLVFVAPNPSLAYPSFVSPPYVRDSQVQARTAPAMIGFSTPQQDSPPFGERAGQVSAVFNGDPPPSFLVRNALT